MLRNKKIKYYRIPAEDFHRKLWDTQSALHKYWYENLKQSKQLSIFFNEDYETVKGLLDIILEEMNVKVVNFDFQINSTEGYEIYYKK